MRRTTIVWILVGAGFVALLLATVLAFPRLLVHDLTGPEKAGLRKQGIDKLVAAESDRRNSQNNTRTTLLQGIAGAALLMGAFLTYRQLQTAREGQITSRYTEAVKQLGDSAIEARLGGIYALERIARDSPRDAPPVAQVLAAFIRGHAPIPADIEEQSLKDLPQLGAPARCPDVQAALDVLGRFPVPHRDGPVIQTDLRRTDLRKAFLAYAKLQDVLLGEAHLEGANFVCAQLQRVELTKARLQGANFMSADLRGASLSGAQLQGADFWSAKLQKANLSGALLRHARFLDANLEGAILVDADLEGANFVDARLRGMLTGQSSDGSGPPPAGPPPPFVPAPTLDDGDP